MDTDKSGERVAKSSPIGWLSYALDCEMKKPRQNTSRLSVDNAELQAGSVSWDFFLLSSAVRQAAASESKLLSRIFYLENVTIVWRLLQGSGWLLFWILWQQVNCFLYVYVSAMAGLDLHYLLFQERNLWSAGDQEKYTSTNFIKI